MGFIFDFNKLKVVDPVSFTNSFDPKITYPKIFTANPSLITLNNVIFFDLESDGVLESVADDKIFVPNIREFTMIHINNLPTTIENVMSPINTHSYVTNTSYSTTINTFCELYKKLGYPCIISHNGYKFDFLLLIAHIVRYCVNAKDIISRMRFFDSYVHLKNLAIYPYKYSNLYLFLRFLPCYPQYAYLQNNVHKSKEDSQMLALWFIMFNR
ncbi:hypothetical protein CsNV_070 [Callinectes sapidus nudivirus]|nr:hypothetical protein CsNV_070 [Callinectes sapidus nudivirus]